MKLDELRRQLCVLSSEKTKIFSEKLIHTKDKIIGVTIPTLRTLAKKYAKESETDLFEIKEFTSYEELMIFGMAIGYKDLKIDERLELLKKFIPLIDNWSTCDSCVATYKFIDKNPGQFVKFLEKYINSSKEYEIRFAIICLLDYYIKEENLDYCFRVCETVDKTQYYVSMAVAWFIATVIAKYPEQGMSFLRDGQIDANTRNRAIRKACESFRVSALNKDIAKSFRVKIEK